jgi:pyrroloquinoline quinone biosynthesis protein D
MNGTIADEAKPRLANGVRLVNSRAHDGWVLLAPERVFKADIVAHAILSLCTGERTFSAIVDDLATRFSAPRDRVAADVAALLNGLVAQRLVEL